MSPTPEVPSESPRDVRLWTGADTLAMRAAGPQGVHVARMAILLLRAREEVAEGGWRGLTLCGAWWQVLLDIKWHLTASGTRRTMPTRQRRRGTRANKGAAC